jgi:NAD(P)-dependent dehydrogenase (short-subunit alcohol dehydrogenase family)
VKLSGKTCLVTGANAGIGKEIARGLLRQGATVVMACRSPERGAAARDELAASTGNPAAVLMPVDLSSQAQIRSFAAEFAMRHPLLHVLVNNAGIWNQQRELTGEGIESTWATNVLGYFLLTELLREPLARAGGARVVSVASEFARGLDLADVQFERRSYSGISAYAQSKQANRMWTWALARRLQGSGVTANVLHPGGVNTTLFRKAGGALGAVASLYGAVMGRTPEAGADTAVWLASSPELEGRSGAFYADRQERACRFRNPTDEERLWELCESMTTARH